ncbi:MAG: hypothetical protein R3A50_17390 [Saprospiraceae bacterium]
MTLERFANIVENPDLLHKITYEELKTLALAYPYAHNLRYFLAIKARQTNHPDSAKNIATAAAYSLDRVQLFKLVAPQMLVPQEVWVEEEVLELKPIETLKKKIEEELIAVDRNTIQEEKAMEMVQEFIEPEPESLTEVTSKANNRVSENSDPADELEVSYLNFSSWIGSFNPPVLGAPEEKDVEQELEVQRKAVDSEPEYVVESIDNQNIEEGKKVDQEEEEESESPKTSGIAQILAEKSVAENKDVISETLAKLYAKQGHRDKAIQMYERLGLAFPEKSTYFAAEIDKLKK